MKKEERRLQTFWWNEAKQHSKDLLSDLQLYFRGHYPIFQVEQTLRKMFSDTYLLTAQSRKISISSEELKELLNGMKLSVPEKFTKLAESKMRGKD